MVSLSDTKCSKNEEMTLCQPIAGTPPLGGVGVDVRGSQALLFSRPVGATVLEVVRKEKRSGTRYREVV